MTIFFLIRKVLIVNYKDRDPVETNSLFSFKQTPDVNNCQVDE